MNISEIAKTSWEIVRGLVRAIPLSLRPLILVIPAAAMLHPLIITGANDRGARWAVKRLGPQIAGHVSPVVSEPNDVRSLLEQSDWYAEKKKAYCPRRLTGAKHYFDIPTCAALYDMRYADVLPDGDTTRFGLNTAGYIDLRKDLTETPEGYEFVIAERRITTEREWVYPPPQADHPAWRDTTRVAFLWEWHARNRLGMALSLRPRNGEGRNEMTGSAFFERKGALWRLAHVEAADTATDYTVP